MAKGYIAGIGSGGGGDNPDPVFDSVTTELIISETYNVFRSKDGLVFQDEEGDFAYWSRAQGLQLLGQGAVNALISASGDMEFKADSLVIKDHHSNVIFSTAKFEELLNETPYRAIDDILQGLTNAIANESTQLRAITKLTSTLYSFGIPCSGKVSISKQENQLGYLPPTETDGYGVLYFDYVKGNVNMVYLKWEAEDGKLFEGVVSESTWHKWGGTSTFAAQEENQLLAGIAGGQLYVHDLQVG